MAEDDAPELTAVIPLYRAKDHMADAVRCVEAQEGVRLELVLVDDASGDGTAEVAEALAAKTAVPTRVVRLDLNRGASGARNAGIAAARGAFVAFLDADDLWRPEKSVKQLAMFRADPGLALAGCQALKTAGGETYGMMLDEMPPDPNDAGRVLFEDVIVHTSCAMARAADLKQELFDEDLRIAEDRDLWLRLALRGRVAIHPEVLAEYRHTPGSLMKREGVARAEDAVRMAEMNVERWGARLTRAERRRALGRAHYDVGETVIAVPGEWGRAVKHLAASARLGFRPWESVKKAVVLSPLVRAVRGG